MKSTGIIMSFDHPRKVMDGTKTKTRRTAGLGKINEMPDIWGDPHYDDLAERWLFWQLQTGDCLHVKCPYGHAGDQLWVRETYAVRADGVHQIMYKADYEEISELLDIPDFCERWGYPQISIKWKPSIHMFKDDSRGNLDITEVHPERLQDITDADIVKEGVEGDTPAELLAKFQGLWNKLNEKRGYPWSKNPWVWVLTTVPAVKFSK